MCKDAPKTPKEVREAAKMNAQTARDALSFYKDVYTNDLLPMQREQADLSRQLIERYIDNMEKQDRFADEQRDYYESTFKPIEQQMAKDAAEYDSKENVERRQGIAAAATNQQFSNAQQQTARMLSRYGVNPNSSAFAQTNAKLMRDQALASAGAQTGAAFDTMDKAIALRAGASNFGRNMPNTAANYYTLGNASAGGAMGTSSAMQGQVAANTAMMQQGFNTSMQGNESAANLYMSDYNARMQAAQAQNQAISGIVGLGVTAGIGALAAPTGFGMQGAANSMAGRNIFAMKADGGAIHSGGGKVRGEGDGSGIDDKVPALLSDGEYVIPADVVKAKGVEFFDKLKKKYHTPAAEQRRQAIQRG